MERIKKIQTFVNYSLATLIFIYSFFFFLFPSVATIEIFFYIITIILFNNKIDKIFIVLLLILPTINKFYLNYLVAFSGYTPPHPLSSLPYIIIVIILMFIIHLIKLKKI